MILFIMFKNAFKKPWEIHKNTIHPGRKGNCFKFILNINLKSIRLCYYLFPFKSFFLLTFRCVYFVVNMYNLLRYALDKVINM